MGRVSGEGVHEALWHYRACVGIVRVRRVIGRYRVLSAKADLSVISRLAGRRWIQKFQREGGTSAGKEKALGRRAQGVFAGGRRVSSGSSHRRPCRSPSSAVGGGRYATALASSTAGSDRGGAPTGVDAVDRCGGDGDNHAATGQMALPAQLGQLSRLVNITSQSRQNNASASLIGSWNNIVSDSIGCSMAHPPWVISEEAGGAVTPRAGPMSYVRCTVPISRGKTDATGSSRAETHAHRAEGDGGRHSPRGPRAAARRELPAAPRQYGPRWRGGVHAVILADSEF